MPSWITEHVAVSGGAISPDQWSELVEEMGFSAVVNLRAEYQDRFGPPFPVSYLWLPVVDHADPTLEQMLLGVQFIDAAVRAGRRVLIHCKMGLAFTDTGGCLPGLDRSDCRRSDSSGGGAWAVHQTRGGSCCPD